MIGTLLVIIKGIKNLVYSGCKRGDITSQFIKIAFLMHNPNPIILIHEKSLVQCCRIPDRQPVWPGDLARKKTLNKLETILYFPFCLTPCPSISTPINSIFPTSDHVSLSSPLSSYTEPLSFLLIYSSFL